MSVYLWWLPHIQTPAHVSRKRDVPELRERHHSLWAAADTSGTKLTIVLEPYAISNHDTNIVYGWYLRDQVYHRIGAKKNHILT